MSLRIAAVVLARLVLSILVPVGAGILVVLPLHYPIASPAYQFLPTIVPIAGAACSALIVAILLRLSGGQNNHQTSWPSVVAIGAFAFVSTWYLTMLLILNIKGS